MTDKQIIIDGIDVSECIYYEDSKCLNGEMVQCNCKNVVVCYYKEYKRKEQECDELAYENYELNELFDRLKAENDELKKKCNIYTCGICGNKEDCNKLYKTLTEIKDKLTVHKTLYYESKLIEKLHKEILQKISECEGNDG